MQLGNIAVYSKVDLTAKNGSDALAVKSLFMEAMH
jgi:hypothetical protein